MNLKIASALAALAASATEPPGAQVKEFRDSFLSGGKKVGIEGFEPQSGRRAPAVLVLHGAGGIGYGNGHIRQLASAFAANGFATYLVHYFDRTGSTWAGDQAIRTHFEMWVETARDAVSYVATRPAVDPARIATFGFSLGGYLAVAHAATDSRVRAVVELAGGIDPTYAARVKRLPPTLILHGEEDQRVLPARARELEQLLRKLGSPHETKLYPGEGHMFSPLAGLDALGREMAFLRKFVAGDADAKRGG